MTFEMSKRKGYSRIEFIHRCLWLLTLCLGMVVICSWPARAAQPNVLFILSDDLGYQDLGVYGSPEIQTPHLDQLASQGMRFTQFYTDGSVCTPTRVSLLTGRYPQRFGFREGMKSDSSRGVAGSVSTLPSVLRSAGYQTHHVGKWHVGHARPEFRPLGKGYDSFFGFLHAWLLPRTYFDPELVHDEEPPRRIEGHLEDLLAQEVLGFLASHRPDDPPFFLSYWTFSPHTPYEAPPRWAEKYPANRDGQYKALISTLDENVGRVLAALRAAGLEESTIVVFASDNGGVGRPFLQRDRNGPFRGIKNEYYEGGIRVPLIVRWPGHVPAGAVRDDLVVSHDWLPTLLEWTGTAAPPEGLDGRSIVPILEGRGLAPLVGPVFWEDVEFDQYRYAVRQGRWKLVVARGQAELFDLSRDPGERIDRATEHPEVVQLLESQYRAWRLGSSSVSMSSPRVEGSATLESGTVTIRGGSDALVFADGPMLDPGDGEMTVAAWICPDRVAERPERFAHKGGAWSLVLEPGGSVRLDAERVVLESAPKLIAPGTCHHVALTFFHPGLNLKATTVGQLRLFVDGVEAASGTTPGPMPPNDDNLVFGTGLEGRHPWPTVYNTALTERELGALVAAGPPSGLGAQH